MASIWIVGSGVVGQATGRGFARRNHAVTFIDVDRNKIESLKSEGLVALTPLEARSVTLDPAVIVLTVPTPTIDGAISLEPLRAASREVGLRLRTANSYPVVVVRSTVVPGTTQQVVIPILEQASGKRAGHDFGVCMNPEFLREKTAVTDFDEPRLVVIGQLDARSGDALAAIYRDFTCPVYRLTLQEAELQKYAHNLFNAVKISFFNEFRAICRQAGAEPEAIFPLVTQSAEAMWNHEYGTRDFGAFDGMCLPKDTDAFLDWAHGQGWAMPVLAVVVASNKQLLKEQDQARAGVVKETVTTAVPVGA